MVGTRPLANECAIPQGPGQLQREAPAGTALPIEGVVLSLQDLIGYFEPPSEELQHEEKQSKLRSLRNRQSLFHFRAGGREPVE
ncbi:Ryanodine receptor 1 [Myotis brandtii]|uniref:Ryanodine receptor 1 n=1 Tax=Myotis brandtii TaxID=109478 RepID=S7MKY4_MYOBR|nr:Ryanodine receptor 1 [Myotis brandtii]